MAKGQKSSSAVMNSIFHLLKRVRLALFQYLNQNPFISTGIYWQDRSFEPKFKNDSKSMMNFEQNSTPEGYSA